VAAIHRQLFQHVVAVDAVDTRGAALRDQVVDERHPPHQNSYRLHRTTQGRQ